MKVTQLTQAQPSSLDWIRQSGLAILEKGLRISRLDRIDHYFVDDIITNYVDVSWSVAMPNT